MAIDRTLPLSAGIGLKPQHYRNVLGLGDDDGAHALPGWVEIHPQNYFCAGGPPHRWLAAIAEAYPVSMHSVGLSLGSADGCDRDELEAIARLAERFPAASISDHLSWSGNAHDKLPDLLPIPYSFAALDHVAGEVSRVQDRLRRPMLIENPSRMLAWRGDAMDEAAFLTELCRRTGCGLILDLNNIVVSATNVGLDPAAMADAIDPALVGEIHLAGHAREEHDSGPLLIDDHGSPVGEAAWALYRRFIARAGPVPTLIEWDTNVPDYAVLIAEAAKADRILESAALVPA